MKKIIILIITFITIILLIFGIYKIINVIKDNKLDNIINYDENYHYYDKSSNNKESHTYSEEIITKKGHLTDGLVRYTCNKCYYSYEEILQAEGHLLKCIKDDKYKASIQTCESPSKYYYVCDCGYISDYTYEDDIIVSHQYVNFYDHNYHYQKCSVCNLTTRKACHEYDNNFRCTICNYQDSINTNLEFELSEDLSYYSVKRIKDNDDFLIIIPSTYLDLPVKEISDNAFKENKEIVYIYLPNSIKRIGHYAFYNCYNLKNIVLNDGLEIIGNYAFSGCENIDEFLMPNTVTEIGNNVFSNSRIKKVVLSSLLTKIPDCCFYRCWNLESVVLHESIKVINTQAFYDCPKLTKIKIPDSVERIDYQAFYNCVELSDITMGPNIKSIGNLVFNTTPWLINLINNSSDKVVYYNNYLITAYDNNHTTNINIRPGTILIADNALDNLTYLTTLNIPDGVLYLGNEIITNQNNLKNVVIPNSVIEVGIRIFDNTCIETITTPYNKNIFDSLNKDTLISINLTSCKKLDEYSFEDFYYLQTISLPNDLECISTNAFYRCNALKTINIPSSVNKIEYHAFYCSMINPIFNYDNTKEEWNKIASLEFYLYNCIIHCTNGVINIIK